jgi:catechol 2,3-dioxygenase-like lactoylglutathione lyase family enzyme
MFKVEQIDHVELFVPDRHEGARWYERTLGLTVVSEFEHWAEDAQGPLMISSGGGTKLALFAGEPRGSQPTAGFHRVAFRVDGPRFFEFLEQTENAPVPVDTEGEESQEVRPPALRDHGRAFSVYFRDPWGHRLEVTTYDEAYVRSRLA